MRIATLICIADGEVDGDVECFDISTPKGIEVAANAWKARIKYHWDADSEEEVLSRIEDGIINGHSYKSGEYSFDLFFGNLKGVLIKCDMEFIRTKNNFKYEDNQFNKIACIKVIREVTGASLGEAKKFTEGSDMFILDHQIKELHDKGVYVTRHSHS